MFWYIRHHKSAQKINWTTHPRLTHFLVPIILLLVKSWHFVGRISFWCFKFPHSSPWDPNSCEVPFFCKWNIVKAPFLLVGSLDPLDPFRLRRSPAPHGSALRAPPPRSPPWASAAAPAPRRGQPGEAVGGAETTRGPPWRPFQYLTPGDMVVTLWWLYGDFDGIFHGMFSWDFHGMLVGHRMFIDFCGTSWFNPLFEKCWL